MKKVKASKNITDQHHLNAKKTKSNEDLIAAVTATIEKYHRSNIRNIAQTLGASYGTISRILPNDLNLVNKSACWVPTLLTQEQKDKRVMTSMQFVSAVRRNSMTLLEKIVVMDETVMSFHTPTTKNSHPSGSKRAGQSL